MDVPDSVRRTASGFLANIAGRPTQGGSRAQGLRTSRRTRPTHIHADIAGPFKVSTCGKQYFLVLTDDHFLSDQVYFSL